MRTLRLLVIWCAVTATACAGPLPVARWLGEVTEDSLSKPGFFGKLVKVIAGGEEFDRLAYPFDVRIAGDHYLFLSRQTNDVVLVNRESYRTRVLNTGDAGLIAPVAVVGDAERYYLSDPEQSAVFIGHKSKLKLFAGADQGLKRPTGLAWDRDRERLWVVDTELHKVLCFDLDANRILELGGRGDGPSGLNYPTFIALFRDGSVAINDTMNGRIKKWSAEGELLWNSEDLLTAADPLGRAKGVAVDASDRVLVVDNMGDRVFILAPDGAVLGSFGSQGSGDGELWSPVGIAVAGDTVVVADTQNHRLVLFALEGGLDR